MDFEAEIEELKRRVGDLECAVGMLTGNIGQVFLELVQLRELSAKNFGNIDTQMGRFLQRLDTMNSQVWSLRDDLPGLVATALRRGGTTLEN